MKRNTKRERKIAKFKGAGLSTYDIAQILGMKQPNVQRTLTRLKREATRKIT
jgi:DNA-binding CsgD family transcriptional regulator